MPRLALYSYIGLLVIGAVLSSVYGDDYRYEQMGFWLLVFGSLLVLFKVELAETRGRLLAKIKRSGEARCLKLSIKA